MRMIQPRWHRRLEENEMIFDKAQPGQQLIEVSLKFHCRLNRQFSSQSLGQELHTLDSAWLAGCGPLDSKNVVLKCPF